ncbi:hypothetical protein LPJ70_001762, partial [Coemansia sp. RSA 2708]
RGPVLYARHPREEDRSVGHVGVPGRARRRRRPLARAEHAVDLCARRQGRCPGCSPRVVAVLWLADPRRHLAGRAGAARVRGPAPGVGHAQPPEQFHSGQSRL